MSLLHGLPLAQPLGRLHARLGDPAQQHRQARRRERRQEQKPRVGTPEEQQAKEDDEEPAEQQRVLAAWREKLAERTDVVRIVRV